MIILTVFALLMSLALLLWALQLRTQLRRMQVQTMALAERIGAMPPAPRQPVPGKPTLITIEILNFVELARKESWFAGAFASISPALLRRIVYARTLGIMQQQLLQFDVKADVQLLGDA